MNHGSCHTKLEVAVMLGDMFFVLSNGYKRPVRSVFSARDFSLLRALFDR